MVTLYDSKDDIEQDIDQIYGMDQEGEAEYPHPSRHRKPPDNKKKSKDNIKKLNQAVKGAKKILFKTKTIFPFDLFPDEILIDENKVDIVSGNFFYSKDIYSIPIQNISGVNSSFDLFFGQLRIEAWGLNKVPQPIKFLSKKDALEARRILSGLIMANNEEIDLRDIPLHEAKMKLREIGKARESKRTTTS